MPGKFARRVGGRSRGGDGGRPQRAGRKLYRKAATRRVRSGGGGVAMRSGGGRAGKIVSRLSLSLRWPLLFKESAWPHHSQAVEALVHQMAEVALVQCQ
jgi:hypothetical protein